MREPPSGTVTFLFTDLEGSTRLWEEHPDAMQGALARHDEILRDAIAAHDGHIVKMTGDGAHAAFVDAASAVLAARDAQLALSVESWGATGPLRVRMGVHTGPAEARDGDYFGTAVNRAARVMSVAHGGQIVVSLTTEELLRDAMPDGCELVDLGEHRLRDLARAERIFQLAAEDLAHDFPPLRSLDAYVGNLPTQLTSFVGRDDELSAVIGALGASRLVTLTGVGGVGKTRLAIQAAAELTPEFPDGAWLCELAAATDEETFAELVAATLGVTQRPGATLAASIVESMHSKRALVVLDNCEHLLGAAGRLAESLLGSCPDVVVLATSREGLGVPGEQVWPLRSLEVSAAARLFAERAQSIVPGWRPDTSGTNAVYEICTRLDGIPLAVELAAARVGAMSATEIATLLDERFRLLTGGRRTAVERHQTLRATVDWSYSMLDERERLVFDRLGVFAGSFDAAAAAAVISDARVEAWDVRDALMRLVARSMLLAEQTSEDVTRYSMLETLRQYARERLDESGDADAWRRRHAEHYARLAEELGRLLHLPEEIAGRRRIRLDLDNFRAAVSWSLDRATPDDLEHGIAIVAELAVETATAPSGGVGSWAERMLDCLEHTTRARRLAVHSAAAFFAQQCRGDPDRALALARPVLDEVDPLPPAVLGLAYNAAAIALIMTGRWDERLSLFDAGHAALAASGDDGTYQVMMYSASSALCSNLQEFDRARAEAGIALELARRVRVPTALVLALFATALANIDEQPELALGAVRECIALARAGASDVVLGIALATEAMLGDRAGDLREGLVVWRESVAIPARMGDQQQLAYTLYSIVPTFDRSGETRVATEVAGWLHGGVQQVVARQHFERDGEQLLAGLRDGLGDEEFEHAMAAGAQLTVDEVVELTLSTLDALIERE